MTSERSTPSLVPSPALPLRVWLRFADPACERRFVAHYVQFYFRFAQVSLLLGMVLIAGDYLVDALAQQGGEANVQRLTIAVPVLLAGLLYSAWPGARRHWQPAMSAFIVTVAICLFDILVRIDAEGGAGLTTWVGVLNFTFLQFYCFVILGVQFRFALPAGLIILGAFAYAMGGPAGLPGAQVAYWSYHLVTLFLLAAGIGWWREFLLRMEFVARTTLDDSRAAAERRATQIAHYDDVTGLPTRRLFAELAGPALERARRHGTGCAVLHVELGRIVGVNDVFGRAGADAVMHTLAQRLRTSVRGSDLASAERRGDEGPLLARSGDGFTLLIADLSDQKQAAWVAKRLLQALATPVVVDDDAAAPPLVMPASIGIALFPGDADDLPGLTRCAEQAARAAAGGNGARHRFFDEPLNAALRNRLLLESELHQAIATNQLHLHFQPKIDVRTGALVGAEALVRWQHPVRGMVPPAHFVALAEECGLIAPLTLWVVDAACATIRRWRDDGRQSPTIAVNLAASCLQDVSLLDRLDGLLQRHRLQPSDFILEITESAVVRDVDSAVLLLEALRARGYGLALDDFGTGYSSLSYLARLPVDELKIDRSFVTDVADGGRNAALTATVIAIGRELGLQVMAEGVETEEQSTFLRGHGCHVQQGYLFSKPMPAAALAALLPTHAAGDEPSPHRSPSPLPATSDVQHLVDA